MGCISVIDETKEVDNENDSIEGLYKDSIDNNIIINVTYHCPNTLNVLIWNPIFNFFLLYSGEYHGDGKIILINSERNRKDQIKR